MNYIVLSACVTLSKMFFSLIFSAEKIHLNILGTRKIYWVGTHICGASRDGLRTFFWTSVPHLLIYHSWSRGLDTGTVWENLGKLSFSSENIDNHSRILPELNPRRPYGLSWIGGLASYKVCFTHMLHNWVRSKINLSELLLIFPAEKSRSLSLIIKKSSSSWGFGDKLTCIYGVLLQPTITPALLNSGSEEHFYLSCAEGFSLKENPVTLNNSK